MKSIAVITGLATVLFASISFAANTVADGYYLGSGSWSSTGPNGTVGGDMDMTWEQDGTDAQNLGILKMNGQAVQTFSDQYRFTVSSGIHYTLSRYIESAYVNVGECTESPAGYSCSMVQATPMGPLNVVENGFMSNANTLIRVGTLTAGDGTVTTYSAILVKQ